jgi:hypothetical protein
MADKIDAAIAAQPGHRTPPPMLQFNAVISSTGRPAALVLPEDATDAEILEVMGWIAVVVTGMYRQARAKSGAGRIEVVRSMPPKPS